MGTLIRDTQLLPSVRLGPWTLLPLIMAPMAGITERSWRDLCRQHGAGLCINAMLTSQMQLWSSRKSSERQVDLDEPRPRMVQIVGHDPEDMARAAMALEEQGADLIDINMGCPAAKVCHRLSGSALLNDLKQVELILRKVVQSVSVPVSLKTRTGWSPDQRNGVLVARIAEDSGISMLTVHGRTRADRFRGHAEYDTLATIKNSVMIPIIANGDIDSPVKAKLVLEQTSADGIMIGRGALGRPWLFQQIIDYLESGSLNDRPSPLVILEEMLKLLSALHARHGAWVGVRYARKHLGWYMDQHPELGALRSSFMSSENFDQQYAVLIHAYGRFMC